MRRPWVARAFRGRVGAVRLALAAAAFGAYTPAFWWGAPHATAADRTNAWGVDDEPPLGPLAQAHDIIRPKPEQNPNLGYPMLHPFMVLGVYAPYVGYLWATGELSAPSVAYPHGFRDPVRALRTLSLLAHLLSVLLGVGTVLAAFEIGRALWDDASGAAGAAGVLLMYPMFYYARNSNVDVPVLFFTAAGLAAFAWIVRNGVSRARALWLSLFVGLAVATKETAFASFLFVPLVLPFLSHPDRTVPPWREASFWATAALSVVVALGAYAAASGLVVDFRRWSAHIEFVNTRLAEARSNGVPWITLYPRTWAGHVGLAGTLTTLLAHTLSWPGLALGVAGVIDAARRSPRQATLALSALGFLVVVFVSSRFGQLRYMLPVALVVAVFTGRLTIVAWRARPRPVAWVGLAASGAAGLTLALWALDLTHGMLRDARHEAGRWIASEARPGDVLEYFGSEHKHPPMPAWLQSQHVVPFLGSMVRPDTTASGVARVREALADRRPRFVVLVPDYTSPPGAPHAASCPPEIYRNLEAGTLAYRRAALIQTASLLPWVRRPPLDYPVVNPPIRIYERVGP
jgi:hypothetical protein